MNSILEGGCACAKVRYELHGSPMIVHACHCTECRGLGGGAFAVNAWTEAENVVVLSGELQTVLLHGGESGQPCEIWFCGKCGTSVWSRYHVSPGNCRFVRVGTLDDPAALQPDVHIWTRSKMAWSEIPQGVPSFEKFYDLKTFWSAESSVRLRSNVENSDLPDRNN